MTLNKSLGLATLAAAAMTALSLAPAWSADNTVEVTLVDKGSDAEMATGLAMGTPGADMAMATMQVEVVAPALHAGKVTFNVANGSSGTVHEMIVAPVPAAGKALPFDASMDRVDEDAAGDLGEVSELEPGQKGSLTLDLKPGRYVLFCNIPGHFDNGMWTVIDVGS